MIYSILTYNVNGIRSAIDKGFVQWLQNHNADIVCLQEIKADDSQINKNLFDPMGYYQYWFPSKKPGYSGVGVLTKIKPDNVVFGMNIPEYDNEGRLIRLDYGSVSLICVYFPSGTTGDIRQDFKMKWLDDFYNYINNLKKERPNLIISGDFNICHKEIDINHPEKHHKSSGFLPEEREWITKFLSNGFIDALRVFNNNPEQYTWWSYRAGARKKNLGWRIDYHIVSVPMKDKLKTVEIHSNINFSDHCPVQLNIDF
jgi:exodeoxyribonuclease-3